MDQIDEAMLRQWIGRRESAEDVLAPRLVRELRATLDLGDEMPAPGEIAPLAVHWCLSPPTVVGARLGADGHPARGGFLPPVPLPRRMWAGGGLEFHDALLVGDTVRRESEIGDVVVKQGRSGTLCFVTVRHTLSTARGKALSERHDIVYRDLDAGPGAARPAAREEAAAAEWRREMTASPTLLFRYSAVTFNGHRIHYDRSYVTGVEGYPGLIVHGPLQATWLLHFAAEIGGRAPARFSFRGVRPLFDFEVFALCARREGDGFALWVETNDGKRTMEARAA